MREGGYEVYPKNLQGLKMGVERRVIELLLRSESHNLERVDAWIQSNSPKFREWFDERKEDLDFLRRCGEERDTVAEEFIRSLDSGSV